MQRHPLLTRRHRGSNAIEFFFALSPVIVITFVFTQFYFLGTQSYFGLTKGYAKAFREAYQRDSSDGFEPVVGDETISAQIYMVPMFRSLSGGSAKRKWQPPGHNMETSFVIGAGSAGQWYNVWDPAIGFVGLAEQYINFPWMSIGFGSVVPAQAMQQPDTGALQDAANNAAAQGQQEANDAPKDVCSQYQDAMDHMSTFRDRAAQCKDPAIYQQLQGPSGPLYYKDDDLGGTPYYMTNPGDDPDPGDLVVAYPPQYYACTDSGFQTNWESGDTYGYGSAAAAQSDYNKGVQGYNDAWNLGHNSGCW